MLIVNAQPVHVKKTSGYLALGFTLLLAIVCGRITNTLTKQRTERTEALETHFEANIGDGQTAVSEQLLGLFNAPVNQILVRRGRKLFAKPAEKMVAGQTGLLGNLIQVERLLITLVDEPARATEPFVNFTSGIDFDVSHFVRRFYCETGGRRNPDR